MIRTCLVALLFAASASACSEQPVEQRRCYMSGWMPVEACDYALHELPSINEGPDVAVKLYAYLQGGGEALNLSEHRDGSGATAPISQILNRDGEPIDWMSGHKVVVHGIFHPDAGTLDVHSIGWIEEPDVPPPTPPSRTWPSPQEPNDPALPSPEERH